MNKGTHRLAHLDTPGRLEATAQLVEEADRAHVFNWHRWFGFMGQGYGIEGYPLAPEALLVLASLGDQPVDGESCGTTGCVAGLLAACTDLPVDCGPKSGSAWVAQTALALGITKTESQFICQPNLERYKVPYGYVGVLDGTVKDACQRLRWLAKKYRSTSSGD